MTGRWPFVLVLALLSCAPVAGARAQASDPVALIDLSNAVVLHEPASKAAERSASVVTSEVERRTGLKWPIITDLRDAKGRPVIEVAIKTEALKPNAPEGFSIETSVPSRSVVVAGHDARGVLYGAFRLIRELRLGPGRAGILSGFRVTTAPKTKLRGHQLGYRAKTNSYDAWDRSQWDRYIRDLVAFGANAVELVPPRTDDDLDSPHFPLQPLAMMTEMSAICGSYDVDVWVWFPVMDRVDTDPSKVEPLLKEWDQVFRALPRLDALFIPGGDPGSIPPAPLFAFLSRAAEVLRRSHPGATIWVSPQGFDAPRMDEFLSLVKEPPPWLHGLVFGPQVRLSLSELRKTVPASLPIRGYPDITHCRQCQHPVSDWDFAYAVTEGREAINPRPLAEAELCRAYRADTIGFITYSEGCNDDVNKAVWSALGWDPDADVVEVLRQYSRYFLGDVVADPFAQALLGLERNWSGPLLTNGGVETTLRQLQAMERSATPALRQNWRFQQALYRGYYDAYVRDRLIQETALQSEANASLRLAPLLGTGLAMTRASAALERSLTMPASPDRRARVFELGEALYQSVGMQLSKAKYLAIDPERGANLDTIDIPLNDRVWLLQEFERVRALHTEPQRLLALQGWLDRENPGPGGFYDDLGDPARSPHLVRDPGPATDPFLLRSPFQGFALRTDWPMAWRQYAQTFYDAPLRLAYDGLDRNASYRVRVVYAGDSPRAEMRLEADGREIHPFLPKPSPVQPVEFAVPLEATRDGRVQFSWTSSPGRGGNGRGCQVAEVWLIREGPKRP
jgi:hypothetical protein